MELKWNYNSKEQKVGSPLASPRACAAAAATRCTYTAATRRQIRKRENGGNAKLIQIKHSRPPPRRKKKKTCPFKANKMKWKVQNVENLNLNRRLASEVSVHRRFPRLHLRYSSRKRQRQVFRSFKNRIYKYKCI